MYQKIYDIVEKKGRVKTGIFLNGENAGLKYLAEEDISKVPAPQKMHCCKKEKKC